MSTPDSKMDIIPTVAGPAGSVGSTGPQGIQGLVGASGTTGATGSSGSVGSKGDKGDTGTAGTAVSASMLSGASGSLSTTAGQVVVVIAKGSIVAGLVSRTISLNYDGSPVDTVAIGLLAINLEVPFVLSWVGTPGAQTKNLTVITTGGTLNGVTMMVTKIG